LSAAPHKAIALFLAEKKDKNLKWREELDELVKSREAQLSKNLKQKMFAPSVLIKSDTDCYLVYDFDEDSVIITKTEDLLELYKNREIKPSSLIRKSNLSEEPVFASDFDFNEIIKKEEDLKAMYGSSITPEQEQFVNWATTKLPGNNNWQKWAVKNHIKDPKQFTTEVMQHLEHYGQSKHIPEVSQVKFLNHDIKQGLEAFRQAEDQYNAKAASKPQLIKPSKKTTKIMDVGDGYAWFNLNTNKCDAESKAMGHCGTAANENQTLLSLRKILKVGDQTYHEPVVTASMDPDGKSLRQIKGRANLIPQPKYHKYIKELLAHTKLTPEGGEYLPGNDFHLDDLSHEEHDDLLAKRPDLAGYSNRIKPELQLKHQMELIKDPKNHKDLAYNLNLHPEAQKQLAQSRDINVLRNLAYNKNLHPEAQKQLAQSKDKYVLCNLAENLNLHPEAQKQLAQSKDEYVLGNLAYNKNLHPELQNQLAQSKDEYVLRNLAKNLNLHPELQNQLAQSKDEYVLGNLAYNKNLHPELQNQLAQSKDEYVLGNLAENLNLHPELQNQLAQSKDEYVLRNLAENLNLHPEAQNQLAQSKDEYVLRNLAKNLNLHPELQNQLAQSKDENVLRNLAYNENLHPELQNQLAQSQDKYVLCNLAYNENLHPELQNQLAQSKDENVLRNLIINLKTDSKIKKEVIKKLQELNPKLAEEAIGELRLEKLKLESENNQKARKVRVEEYFDKLKE